MNEQNLKSPSVFRIDRLTWYRGQSDYESKLLREDGTMCCLGQVGQQCGILDSNLLNKTSPIDCSEVPRKQFPSILLKITESSRQNSSVCDRLMQANDSTDIGDIKRERRIEEIFFKEMGVIVYFEN